MLDLAMLVRLKRWSGSNKDAEWEAIRELDLFEGDGMCVGYHGWMEGDFGENPSRNLFECEREVMAERQEVLIHCNATARTSAAA